MTHTITLNPITAISGEVTLPGSKSISNRLLLLAALAKGTTRLSHLLDSDDVNKMKAALSQLGVAITDNNGICTIEGSGGIFTHGNLYLENAGTAMRSLTATLSAIEGEFTLRGNPRMCERPIADLVDALKHIGADIEYMTNEGYPPLQIHGQTLPGGPLEIDCSISSQFLTAVLMAAPLMKNDVEISVKGRLVSKPYIDITIGLMQRYGVEVINHNYERFEVKSGQHYKAPNDIIEVESDASSASYFMAAAAIGGKIRINGIGKQSLQGDVAFLEVLEKMGAKINMADYWVEVEKGDLQGVDVNLNHIPDAAMTLATTALFAKGTTTIRDIYNWRVKETDRLHAMATELKKVGAIVEEGEDYLVVTPNGEIQHAAIDTYDDHRVAMCFALLALGNNGITINDPECTSKTFPEFFDVFASIASH